MDDGADLVGVVGDSPAGLETAIAATGADHRAGDVESVLAANPDVVLAIGESCCLDVLRATPSVPVMAVDAGRGFPSIRRDVAADIVENVVTDVRGDRATTESVPVLRVEHDGELVGRAVADVTLLSAEVAHISEYGVTAADTPVSQFRADGVVVATASGSVGYAKRVGSPVIAPESDVCSVVPIAPFATDPDHWVVPLSEVRLSVERDETSVTLLADDRDVATVAHGESVTVTKEASAELVVVPESRFRSS